MLAECQAAGCEPALGPERVMVPAHSDPSLRVADLARRMAPVPRGRVVPGPPHAPAARWPGMHRPHRQGCRRECQLGHSAEGSPHAPEPPGMHRWQRERPQQGRSARPRYHRPVGQERRSTPAHLLGRAAELCPAPEATGVALRQLSPRTARQRSGLPLQARCCPCAATFARPLVSGHPDPAVHESWRGPARRPRPLRLVNAQTSTGRRSGRCPSLP